MKHKHHPQNTKPNEDSPGQLPMTVIVCAHDGDELHDGRKQQQLEHHCGPLARGEALRADSAPPTKLARGSGLGG